MNKAAKYLTTTEAAKTLGIHPQSLNRLYLASKLPEPGRLKRQRVLTPEDVAEIRRILDTTNQSR